MTAVSGIKCFYAHHLQRVASANRVEELRHQERWQQMQEETKVALQELRRLCQQREERAQEKFKQIQKDRSRQLKGQRYESGKSSASTASFPSEICPHNNARNCGNDGVKT